MVYNGDFLAGCDDCVAILVIVWLFRPFATYFGDFWSHFGPGLVLGRLPGEICLFMLISVAFRQSSGLHVPRWRTIDVHRHNTPPMV